MHSVAESTGFRQPSHEAVVLSSLCKKQMLRYFSQGGCGNELLIYVKHGAQEEPTAGLKHVGNDNVMQVSIGGLPPRALAGNERD